MINSYVSTYSELLEHFEDANLSRAVLIESIEDLLSCHTIWQFDACVSDRLVEHFEIHVSRSARVEFAKVSAEPQDSGESSGEANLTQRFNRIVNRTGCQQTLAVLDHIYLIMRAVWVRHG